LPLRLPAHHQDSFAVAEQVGVDRRFAAGRVPDGVLLPVPVLALRVLHPVTRRAGEVDDDEVLPAVTVEVVAPAGERPAVIPQAVLVVHVRLHLVRFPVRRFVPELAVEDVDLTVLVHIPDGHAFGPELGIEYRLLPGDRFLVGRFGVWRRGDDRGAGQGRDRDEGQQAEHGETLLGGWVAVNYPGIGSRCNHSPPSLGALVGLWWVSAFFSMISDSF